MMSYNYCDVCKGKHECNLLPVGFKDGMRCRYNLRGTYNTDEILKLRYDQFTCDNLDEIRKHINEHHSIYLHGKYGLGKTHFLMWLANKYNLQAHNVFVILASTINIELRNEISYQKQTNESKVGIATKMRDTELLFIDDIGNEKMTDFVHETMASIIDYRYRHNKPTFITSNYTLLDLMKKWIDEIGDHKSKQLISRIKTFGAIEIKGKNWRNEN